MRARAVEGQTRQGVVAYITSKLGASRTCLRACKLDAKKRAVKASDCEWSCREKAGREKGEKKHDLDVEPLGRDFC